MNKKNTVLNFMWRFAERCGAQGVNFLVSIIIARVLMPEDYGTIALVTVFIAILNVFVDSGLGNALIQKKDVDNLDYSSVFYFNILLCSILYILLFLSAPLISNLYGNPELTKVIRMLGVTLVISGVKNVQIAYVSKTMQFKKFFFSTLGGTIVAAIIGIIMSYNNFGVWALVAQQVVNTAIDTIILWLTVQWRPIAKFSLKRLLGLISYGWKLLVSGLVDTTYNNISQLIIGKFYSTSDLAYYNRGHSFPNLIITNINSSIDSVLFPVMSHHQDELEKMKNITRKSIRMSSYLIWPIVIGLSICAEPLIRVLLTEKWIASVPYMQIFCITYGFWPVHTANLNAIKALGRSDVFLKLEIIKKIIGLISILIALQHGVMAMALINLILSPIYAMVNATPNKRLLNYSYREQIYDMLPAIIYSLIMAVLVYFVKFLNLGDIITLIIQVLLGVIIYIFLSYVQKNESFMYILSILKKLKK